jgi:hypothetical protein
MAMIIPINTNTTIAICIQIQVGDIAERQPTAASEHGLRTPGAGG